jgi:hypothetical protein
MEEKELEPAPALSVSRGFNERLSLALNSAALNCESAVSTLKAE